MASFLLIMASTFLGVSAIETASGMLAKTWTFSSNHYKVYNSRNHVYGSVPSEGVYETGKLIDDETIYRVHYRIGGDGFRVTPSLHRTQSKTSINLFGGSYAFGEGLEDNQTLAYYLGQKLQDRTVKNYGMHGWGLHNALAVLNNEEVKGDYNILLTTPWHALRSFCAYEWTANHPAYALAKDGGVDFLGSCDSITGKYTTWVKRILSYSSLYTRLTRPQEVKKVTREMLDLYLEIIKAIKARTSKNGQKLLVAFIDAERRWLVEEITNEQIAAKIADELVNVTLGDDIENLPNKYFIHTRDKHPTALANEERAELLYQLLSRFESLHSSAQ
ncbi:MAG: hypothetical protein ACI9FD_004674 [Gammaproteobacteria bacterium]|jgi:hypothetical protein